MRTYLGLFLLATFFTVLITPAVRRLGRWLRAYGQVRDGGEERQIPRLGGLAIMLAGLATWGVLLLVPNDVRAQFLSEWRTFVILLVPGAVVLFVGAYDDMVSVSPRQKLIVEALAAGMVWWAGFRIVQLPVLGYSIRNPLVSLLLTLFWIVAVTNSLNLIDGLDGLAAGIAFFVTLSVFVVSLIQGTHFVSILTIVLAGALLGFLRFNFSPATIFLGDSGSLFLGFVLASLAVRTSQKSSTLLAIVVPFAAFGLPLLDTSLTVVRRFLNGRPLFVADQDHIHHRLLQNRLRVQPAVLGLYALAALFSLGSLLIIQSTGSLIALVAVLAGVSGWFLTAGLRYEELSELNDYVARAMQSQRRVLANQILIRKAARQLEEAASLEGSWQILTNVVEALDFDGLSYRLAPRPNGPAPVLFPWSRDGKGNPNHDWSLSIPLRAGDKALGELQLWRTLNKGRLLFQFSSLLDTLIPPFEGQLKRRFDAEGATVAVAQNVPRGSALQANLLANGGKG